jgi:drug/metabolite transporter (DMT)-like permease
MGFWLLKSNDKFKLDKNMVVVTCAGIFLVLNWYFLFKSFQISTITIGNISYYLQPIILIILGIFIYKEKVSPHKWILILLALIGVLLTIDIQNLSSPHIMLGVFLALLAALLYSFLTILMKYSTLSYFKVIFIQLITGILIFLPFVHFKLLSIVAILCLTTIGIVHTLLAYYLYYSAIKKTSFTQIAIFSYLDPIVAIATDVIFFNRQLNYYQMLGIALTFTALTLLVLASHSSKQMKPLEQIN